MPRYLSAATLLILPVLAYSLLLSLGELDWKTCFDAALSTTPQPLLHDLPAVWRAVSTMMWQDMSSIPVLALLALPGLGFAAIALWAPAPKTRNATIILAALFCASVLWVLGPPQSHHDCDRKGTEVIFLFLLIAPMGLLCSAAWFVYLRRTR